jgi:hypothetical protein
MLFSDVQKRGAVQRDSAEDSVLQMAGRQEGGGQKHVSTAFSSHVRNAA